MIGKRVAHFEISSKLGEGGMGVVYEAIDRHLDRRVALKILPPAKVANPARKQRFIQEAKSASALNHPNIITIYDISEADGIDYIAMELVAGRTLEEVLAKRRPRIIETLKYAVQMADALAVAHAAGIVHRDLKPANVMITESGLVKILDFGLAKLADETEVTESDATRTERVLTEEGTVIGSAAYMSPEQAEGKKVDARSDIFSFGLVLYEMLSGQRAFRGETRMSTMAAILNKEPAPLAELAPGLPKELERIVARCLRKELARRSQSIAEVKIALEELKEESESGASLVSAPAVRKPASRWPLLALGGAVLALGAALVFLLPRWRAAPTPLTEVPLTSYTGALGFPALSPDGNQFAFSWDGGQEGAPPQLYVSLIGRGTPLRLTNAAAAAALFPAWSPDGQSIAFVRAGKTQDLVVIPALGGPERRIDETTSKPAWSPDGKWLYFSVRVAGSRESALFVAPTAGGEKRRLLDPPPPGLLGDEFPAVSPDGQHLVFVRSIADYDYDLFVVDLREGSSAGAPRRITTDHEIKRSPVWSGDGKDIVYVAGNPTSVLGIYRVNPSGGKPVRVEGVGGYASGLAIASKSHRLVYSRAVTDYNIWRAPFGPSGSAAGAATKFLSSTRYEISPAYSPDGKRIAFSSNRGGLRQIWVADADGSNPAAVTNFTVGVAGSPMWSPDGQTIVFDARPSGAADIYSVKADGGSLQRLTDHPAEDHLPIYAPDGRSILFASTRSGPRQIYRMPANGGEAVQITRKGAYTPRPSPDGKRIYYFVLSNGLWRVPAEGGEETQVLEAAAMATNPLSHTVTAAGVCFAGRLDPVSKTVPLKLYRFADGKVADIGRFAKPPDLQMSISPDEKWLLYTQLDHAVNDLMLVENFR